MKAALFAPGISPGFQCSKDFWLAWARLAAAPAEESFTPPCDGYDGKLAGLAYFKDAAAPGMMEALEGVFVQ